MGPMLLLVFGILSAVGLALYQFGEHHRFDMVPDAKGGIFIIDRKSAAINYCDNKTCSLVGNGALPSQIMGNPAALMAVQGAIMGAPAAATAKKPGDAPKGMQPNIAASGAKPVNDTTEKTHQAAKSEEKDEKEEGKDENTDASAEDQESDKDDSEENKSDDSGDESKEESAPKDFSFN